MRSFKRVCKSVLAFLLVIALVSAMLAGFYLHTEYYYYQDFKERGDLTGTLDTLYCGASFALRAFPLFFSSAMRAFTASLPCMAVSASRSSPRTVNIVA